MPEAQAPQVLVGLGNPGAGYRDSRHNAGFWCVDLLASRFGGAFRAESRFHGEVARVEIAGRSLILLKPATYMNRSGASVAALARFYRFEPALLLIAHDDLDLPAGTVRLKLGGGHGGHNGLRDLHSHLGSDAYARLRFGIGHPGLAADVVSYVLSRPSAVDRSAIDIAIETAVEQLPSILTGDYARAMNALNRRAPSPE